MILSRKEQHKKLFDQFVYEMFCTPEQSPKSHKPKKTLQSTRQKFLDRIKKQAKEDPGEI